jgi:hypothetical protein
MKTIQLTKDKIALVDDEDYEYLNQWKWNAYKKTDSIFYAARCVWVDKKPKNIYMHRVIMKTERGMMCDHIDHDTLNNQKNNLRNCTRQQNQFNKNKYSVSKNKYKGVSFNGYSWIAKIQFNKKHYYLGTFKTEIDAAKAYDEDAKKYHGEFANLNFK